MFRCIGLLLLLTSMPAMSRQGRSEGPCVIADRGHFRIHVGSSGLFGAFGHDHLIEAQKITGCAILDPEQVVNSSIQLEFAADGLRVMDPKESAKDRAEVQKTMETEVLKVSSFPRIRFESTAVERSGGSDRFRVRGNLSIRDKTQTLVVPVSLTHLADGTYRAVGESKFKQTSFGIKPVKVAGGTVKVKDELSVEFELFLR